MYIKITKIEYLEDFDSLGCLGNMPCTKVVCAVTIYKSKEKYQERYSYGNYYESEIVNDFDESRVVKVINNITPYDKTLTVLGSEVRYEYIDELDLDALRIEY